MTVAELIAKLQTLPPEEEIYYVYDGAPRGDVAHVWLARSGEAILAGAGEYVYSGDARPESAPTEEEDRYWKTP